jgi:hypothetical protein
MGRPTIETWLPETAAEGRLLHQLKTCAAYLWKHRRGWLPPEQDAVLQASWNHHGGTEWYHRFRSERIHCYWCGERHHRKNLGICFDCLDERYGDCSRPPHRML